MAMADQDHSVRIYHHNDENDPPRVLTVGRTAFGSGKYPGFVEVGAPADSQDPTAPADDDPAAEAEGDN